MKGEKIFKILSLIEEGIEGYGDLFDAICFSGARGFFQVQREISRIRSRRLREKEKAEERARFSKLIYKLKKEGYIQEKQNKLLLTLKGKLKLLFFKEKYTKEDNKEKEIKENELIIFIYDIPEIERRLRDRLRSLLKTFKFKYIQKSVWFKKGNIEEDFFTFLQQINPRISNYIHIFKISHSGTLTELKI